MSEALTMTHTSARFGGHTFRFGRINVILGANGVGKSKLLQELKSSLLSKNDGSKVVFVEGGRAIKINDVLQLNANNFNRFDKLAAAIDSYDNKRQNTLADRVYDALIILDRMDLQLRAEHSDSVEEWMTNGQKGECPRRPEPPLQQLFDLFNEIFPQIILSYSREQKRLSAKKGNDSYGPSAFSDGEKQVFSILADLIGIQDSFKTIVVDEPELNLHPELAERLWTLIETEYPDKAFIYATHSIYFSLRDSVEKVYVLSTDSEKIVEFTSLDDLPRADTSAFLGGIPGILSANRVLVTEGHDKSFDAIFYRWLLDDNRVEVFPAGGCTDVVDVVSKSGLWNRISTRIKLAGVVDADFRDQTYLESLKTDSVHVLGLHEAESYLWVPEILCAIANRIGTQEETLTTEIVGREIIAQLIKEKLQIAARRVFSRAHIRLAVSVQRKVLTGCISRDELVTKIERAASEEIAKAAFSISANQLVIELDKEIADIDDVAASSNVMLALTLLPAKTLINTLAPKAGCRNENALMRSLRRNFSPADFPITAELANAIKL